MSDTSNRLRMIRILSGGTPKTEQERLEKIRKLAAGEMTVHDAQPRINFERLRKIYAEGSASRSPRTAADIVAAKVQAEEEKPEPEKRKKRKLRSSYDRQELGGRDRSATLTSSDDPSGE